MTNEVQIALIVAIPPTVTAMGGVFVGLMNSRRTAKAVSAITETAIVVDQTAKKVIAVAEKSEVIEKKADILQAKTNIVIDKANEIHTVTNSANSELRKSLDIANEKINGLSKLIAEMAANRPRSAD